MFIHRLLATPSPPIQTPVMYFEKLPTKLLEFPHTNVFFGNIYTILTYSRIILFCKLQIYIYNMYCIIIILLINMLYCQLHDN